VPLPLGRNQKPEECCFRQSRNDSVPNGAPRDSVERRRLGAGISLVRLCAISSRDIPVRRSGWVESRARRLSVEGRDSWCSRSVNQLAALGNGNPETSADPGERFVAAPTNVVAGELPDAQRMPRVGKRRIVLGILLPTRAGGQVLTPMNLGIFPHSRFALCPASRVFRTRFRCGTAPGGAPLSIASS
jgi:hypothetical protein